MDHSWIGRRQHGVTSSSHPGEPARRCRGSCRNAIEHRTRSDTIGQDVPRTPRSLSAQWQSCHLPCSGMLSHSFEGAANLAVQPSLPSSCSRLVRRYHRSVASVQGQPSLLWLNHVPAGATCRMIPDTSENECHNAGAVPGGGHGDCRGPAVSPIASPRRSGRGGAAGRARRGGGWAAPAAPPAALLLAHT